MPRHRGAEYLGRGDRGPGGCQGVGRELPGRAAPAAPAVPGAPGRRLRLCPVGRRHGGRGGAAGAGRLARRTRSRRRAAVPDGVPEPRRGPPRPRRPGGGGGGGGAAGGGGGGARGGGPPRFPVARALPPAVVACATPAQPFYDLIAANRQDQVVSRYATFGDLEDYCRLSANPVG